MEKNFTSEPHFMMKAVAKAGIFFPISKADCIAKAGEIQVKVDFDRYVPLRSILERMAPEHFDNASHFYNAYMSAQTQQLAEEYGYYK